MLLDFSMINLIGICILFQVKGGIWTLEVSLEIESLFLLVNMPGFGVADP